MRLAILAVAVSCSGCVEFLEAVAVGGSTLGHGMIGQPRPATHHCFSNESCEADQVCAVGRYTGYGVCVNPTELARQ